MTPQHIDDPERTCCNCESWDGGLSDRGHCTCPLRAGRGSRFTWFYDGCELFTHRGRTGCRYHVGTVPTGVKP